MPSNQAPRRASAPLARPVYPHGRPNTSGGRHRLDFAWIEPIRPPWEPNPAEADVLDVLRSTPWPITLAELVERFCLRPELQRKDRWQALGELIRRDLVRRRLVPDPFRRGESASLYELTESGRALAEKGGA
jgi:hypothetical protein